LGLAFSVEAFLAAKTFLREVVLMVGTFIVEVKLAIFFVEITL
jgi:hypothetical protein